MVSVCLPSDALLQHLVFYLGFSYLGCGVSLHSCSSKAQPLLLSLDEGYLLTTAPPDLERGVAPLSPPMPTQPPLLGCGVSLHGCSSKAQPLLLTLEEVAPPDLERGVAPLSPPAPAQPRLLGRGVAPLGRRPWDWAWASPTRCTWVWCELGSWWWKGRPSMLRFMGLQRVRHDWATELSTLHT